MRSFLIIITNLLLIALVFLTEPGFGQSQTYSTAGSFNWTCPTGVTEVTVECWGGGGAGGGQNDTRDGGGGGGGGAYSAKTMIVVPGNIYSVNVGTGGIGVAGGTGGDGNDSWFIDIITVLAKGGKGGQPSTGTPPPGGLGGDAAGGIGTSKFSGGQGEAGYDNNTGVGGYGGSSAGNSSDGWSGPQNWATATYPTGSTPAGGGHGGDGGAANNNGLSPVSGSGGGGGGSGEGTMLGGNGYDGKVVISWPTLTIGNNAIAVSNVCPYDINVPIHGISLTGENGGGLLTNFSFVTTGSYLSTDISNFKLYYTTTSTFATTNLVATIAAPTTAGTQTFPAFSQSIGTGTFYLWVTTDMNNATPGNTIAVNGTLSTNITVSGAQLLGGPSTASGIQTFLSTTAGVAGIITGAAGANTVCPGESGVGAYTVTAIAGATGYVWTLPSGASIATGANTNSITVDYSGAAISGYITVQGNDGTCGGAISPAFAISVLDEPIIVEDPESQNGCIGSSVVFSVIATGGGLTYQWRKGGVDIGGATSDTYLYLA